MTLPANMLATGIVGFLVGNLVAVFFFGGIGVVLGLVLFGVIALLFGRRTGRRTYALATLILLSSALGVLRYDVWKNSTPDRALLGTAGKESRLTGLIVDEPDVRETHTNLTVRLSSLETVGNDIPVDGVALLVVDRFPEFAYGDTVTIDGILKIPERFSEESGHTFDYPMYLRTKGVSFTSFRPDLTLIARGGGSKIRSELFALKRYFVEGLGRSLPEPERALAGGLLLGERRALGGEWTERFRRAGIIHIVVLSGYNMTIVADWLRTFFLFLGFAGSIIAASFGIILFAVMVGGGATVVRAAIMALLALLARATGKSSAAGRALLIAAGMMVALEPGILAHDPSFQLSFLATAGLIWGGPAVGRIFPAVRRLGRLGEPLEATIATQAVVLPLLLYQTGLLSIVALPVNLIVLPLIPIAMFFSFVAGVGGCLGAISGLFAGIPANGLLALIFYLARTFAELPFAVMTIPPFAGWLLFLIYGALIAGYCFLRFHRHAQAHRSSPKIVKKQ